MSETVNNYYLDFFEISSAFGEKRGSDSHKGVDFNLPGDADLGKDILAIDSGKVIRKEYQAGGAGYYLVLEHANGLISKYMHMIDGGNVKVGDTVTAGQKIGRIGNTGGSTGAHLHLELEQGGKAIDPIAWLKGKVLAPGEGGGTSGGITGGFKETVNEWIESFKDYSFTLILLILGLLLLLYTLYSMFLGNSKIMVRRKGATS